MLKRNSFKFLCKFSACLKLESAGRIGDFGNFLNGFAESPRVLRWSWILNECNLSWKIVKYCILYEVCMIKTAPHRTLSPQTWCIKKYKRLVCTHPDLLARICNVNLSNAKNSTWFVFQQEDARGRLRGMCGCKKELRVCWMAMESWVVYTTNVCRRDGDVLLRTNTL